MKLLELIGIKKFYDADMEEVLSSMKDTNYTELGRGSFAVTLKNASKPGVVKFWIKDSSYDDFINYVVAHPSRYFPKLLSKPKELSSFFLRPENFPDKIRYVKMEELQHIKDDNDANMISNILGSIAQIQQHNVSFDSDEKFEKYVAKIESDKWGYSTLSGLVADIPDFCDVMREFIEHVVKGSNRLDIHEENIMERSNGEIVITDPVYNVNDHEDALKIEKQIENGANTITGSGKKKREIETKPPVTGGKKTPGPSVKKREIQTKKKEIK